MRTSPDLHTHSTASDGTLTPGGHVDQAVAAGVEVLALTDHDTTDGLQEAGAAAARKGMLLIPGVSFTNGVRDLLGGDLAAGFLRISEAVLITVAIAAGFALPLLMIGGA